MVGLSRIAFFISGSSSVSFLLLCAVLCRLGTFICTLCAFVTTSGGAKSYRLVGSRIGKPCPLESMPPNMISKSLQLYKSTNFGPCARFL